MSRNAVVPERQVYVPQAVPCGGGRVGLITGQQRRNSYIEMEAAYAQRIAQTGSTPVAIRIDERGGEQAAAEAADNRTAHAGGGAGPQGGAAHE